MTELKHDPDFPYVVVWGARAVAKFPKSGDAEWFAGETAGKVVDTTPKPWEDAKPGDVWSITTKDGGTKTLWYAAMKCRDNSEQGWSIYLVPVDDTDAPKLGLKATVITAGRRIWPEN